MGYRIGLEIVTTPQPKKTGTSAKGEGYLKMN